MTRFARCVFLLVFTFNLSFVSSHAQSAAGSSQPASAQQAPPANVATLHTGAKLVVVDVIVHDKNGKPIHGLTRDEFVISEGGKPQTLNSFEEYAKPAAPAAVPAMPQLPPGMFTDFTPVAPKGPLNVLILDGLNTEILDQAYFRKELLNYVATVPPGTRIAIFGMADHLYLLQGFTSDPTALRAVLTNMKAHPHSAIAGNDGSSPSALMDSLTDPSKGPAASGASSALMTSAIDTFLERITVSQTALRIQLTIEEMTQLAHWLLNFPGRKNVVWASSAFPLGVFPNVSPQSNTDIPGEQSDIYMRMINLLTEAQVSIYPIDPQGLAPEPVFQAASSATSLGRPNVVSETLASSNQRASEQATMQAIASDTGGEPFYNRNNLTMAVGDALDSGANYYTITYSPSEKKTAGEWRSIRVALATPEANKGAQLSYRNGYFADNLKVPAHHTGTAEVSEDPNAPSVESSRNSRLAMLHGAPTRQDIPFTVRVLPASTSTEDTVAAGNGPDPKDPMKPPYRRYDVDCAAAARYFFLAEQPNGNRVGSVQAAVFIYDPRGKLLNTVSRTLHFDFTPAQYADFQRLGFREHLEVSAPAKGESFLRIGIEEKTSGRIGTIEVASSAVSNLPPPEYAQVPTGQTKAKAAPDSSSRP